MASLGTPAAMWVSETLTGRVARVSGSGTVSLLQAADNPGRPTTASWLLKHRTCVMPNLVSMQPAA